MAVPLDSQGKPVMNQFRSKSASLLGSTIANNPVAFEDIGSDPAFVWKGVEELVSSAILAGSDGSGDLVRVVTDTARIYLGHMELDQNFEALNDVRFRRLVDGERKLDAAGVIALTKFFVLE
jgi:hypothetical protein